MKNRFLLILIIAVVVLTLTSVSVLAETKNEEIYSGKEFRNPFVEYIDPEPEPEPAPETESEANDNSAAGQSSNNEGRESQRPAPPRITIEDVKSELPFSLNGIISSNKTKVALLNTGGNVEFIRGSYQQEGYQITSIEKESVIVTNRGFRLRLKIGGEIDEI